MLMSESFTNNNLNASVKKKKLINMSDRRGPDKIVNGKIKTMYSIKENDKNFFKLKNIELYYR